MAREEVESEVTGTVWKIETKVGDKVAEGDVLMIIESMKMEIPVEAPCAGVLSEIRVAEGQTIGALNASPGERVDPQRLRAHAVKLRGHNVMRPAGPRRSGAHLA